MKTEQREQIRAAILVYLADRPQRAFSVSEIFAARAVRNAVDAEFDESHIQDALAVLIGFGLVQRVPQMLAGLDDYKATAEGVVFRERNYP